MNATRTLDAPAVQPVKSYEEELLDLIARQSRQVPFAVFVVLMVVASLMYSVSTSWTLVWAVLVVAVLGLRYAILPRLPTMSRFSLAQRVNLAALLSGTNGLVHATSLVAFPYLTDVERMVQSLILAGLCTGAVATTGGSQRVFLPYLGIVYLPMIALWSGYAFTYLSTGSGIGLAMSIVVFAVVLLMLSRDTDRQFRETIRIRKVQEETNMQLQKALQDAGVADRAKTRFLASASHDLRQPIHALSLFGAALKMQQLPDSAGELADNIGESINVLASQLDSLLDISKLDAGVIKPDLGAIDLRAMLTRIAREIEPEVEEKGLSLAVDFDEKVVVHSDKLLLERVVRNLISNALRYTNTGGIRIECHREGDMFRLTVADTGIGIPEQEQQKIFGEFYQVSERTESSQQGLGLGLSIVTRLLALLEAPLELQSTQGEGTRVMILFTPWSTEIETREQESMARLRGIRVLVIDDDAAVRNAMTALLQGFGADPESVGSVAEAVKSAGTHCPDVVISDLRLGAESGIDAIARIRQRHGALPALLITGDTGAEQIREAHASGLEVMHKPVLASDLEKTLATVVELR